MVSSNAIDAAPPACHNETQSSSWQRSAVRTARSDLMCICGYTACVTLCVCMCGRKQNIVFVLACGCVKAHVCPQRHA